MAELTNPHDRFFKEMLARPEAVRDFLMHYLPAEVVELLEVSHIETVKDSFVDAELREYFSDLLFKVGTSEGGDAYVYVLFEHKSHPDAMVAFQVLRYMVRIWEHHWREQGSLWPILPVVVYHGEMPWPVERNLQALFHLPEVFRAYTPEYRYASPRIEGERMLFDRPIRQFALLMVACGWTVAGHAAQPRQISAPKEDAFVLTPEPGPQPRINGPKVYGCRPGNPFLYRIPTTGQRPMKFVAVNLPEGLSVDSQTGIITGAVAKRGEYAVTLEATNSQGSARRPLKIVCGDLLALTPPMGWNHWYAHYNRITDKMMREAADAMVSSGMADVGYQYVSIDDCWMNAAADARRKPDPLRVGPFRDTQGKILPNKHFPDMKALTDYIHGKGLKAGIYTSPGPLTCAGFAGSYQHEAQDAKQFADWGFDFLKYDWCSYRQLVNNDQRPQTFKKPYKLMGDLLKQQRRDIVYNLCQYGLGNVWEWGAEVGGHSWRTAGDLGYYLDKIFDVALKNAEHREYSRPGSWNDPDYIQIGYVGAARRGGEPEPCPLTPNEQYSFMSLWSLMASPLFFSGDMSRLDKFTLNVLCNPEVIEVNQDPLGQCARVVRLPNNAFVMVKDLEDGSKAVGLFNRGETEMPVTAQWTDLGVAGKQSVRDLWRQKDLGAVDGQFQAKVARHGVVFVRLTPASQTAK